MDSDYAIETVKLSKRYTEGSPYAVRDVTLQIKKSEVFGFLGPNGAGKSTTIRLLMNFILPTSGRASILGLDCTNDYVEVKKHVGYLSGDVALFDNLTGQEFIDYMVSLRPARKAYVKQLVGRLQMDVNVKLRSLSKGNRQKFGVLQAVMHEPDILILDEPTSGLDPLMQEEFYGMISEARARGATFFISSHNLSEVQRVCDRVAFIKDGKIVDQKNIKDLSDTALHQFMVMFIDKVSPGDIRKLASVRSVEPAGDYTRVLVSGAPDEFIAFLAKHKVKDIATEEATLEQLFMHYYEDGKK